jgi:8-amino-3,8-dideoxy-alpha-D-manno-octulosonate transaminase
MPENPIQSDLLAIDGGVPARQKPEPPMYPGGMEIDEEEEKAVLEVLRTKRLFRYYGPEPGPSKADILEKEFAQYMGVEHALGVTSGTAALVCALQGIGIGPGDEVILPAFTWIASASAVAAVGGIPVLAEVDESLTLDPADVERKITPFTKAIMPVHMRGVPCRMDELLAVAHKHGLKVIEDTAQADGASYHGKKLGSMGDAGCFSFQFNKILTSGEGGMVLTNSDDVWKRAVMFHDVVGGVRNNLPDSEIKWGINFRMPELLAAVMLVQLRRLDHLLVAMRQRKQMLREGFADIAKQKGVVLQEIPDPAGDASVAFIFFLEDAASAQSVSKALTAENISNWLLYRPNVVDYHIYTHWTPIMNQRTWTEAGGPWRWAHREVKYTKDMCPRSLDLLGRAVHLDVNPLYTNQDIEETLDGLNRVIKKLA